MWFQLPVLLTSRLFQVFRIVLRTHNDLLKSGVGQHVRDVDREGSVAALVPADGRPINPNLSRVVDGSEVKKYTMTMRYGGPLECLSVPDSPIEARIPNPAGLCFRRKRNRYQPVPDYLLGVQKLALAIDCEIPFAIEGCPVISLKLRAGVGLIAVDESALKKIFDGSSTV
jgi:hypothetical protein